MIILNTKLVNKVEALIPFNNRGTYFGDGVFETLRVFKGRLFFFEDHYFRLMSSMRILRMDIPDFFTPEFLEQSISDLLKHNDLHDHARIRITVWRKNGGLYTPTDLGVDYAIEASRVEENYKNIEHREVELFKDHFVYPSMLSTLKSTNKAVNILAGIYAQENDYEDLFLMNDKKMIVETISGNVFLRNGNKIKTPPISDGCLKGIMRDQVINQLKKMLDYTIEEETITPFELQRADEIFTTNVIRGVQSITKYRKKNYVTTTADELLTVFNERMFI
jgi:branched-chain amino acid aminotransferase